MKSHSLNLFLLIALTAIAKSTTISHTTIGFTYSAPASISGSVELWTKRIAAKFVSMKIPSVRLLDSNPAVISAFAYTNVSLLLSVPNTLVPILASNRSLAMRWVHIHVLPFHRRTKISTISVGNELITYSPEVSPFFLLRAMQNVHKSLSDLRIYGISVSTTFSFLDIIPSSAAQLNKSEAINISPILQFLEETDSSLLISFCPYNVFRSRCSNPIGIDLFKKLPLNFREDLTTGVKLFDMMVDVVIGSMAVRGHENLPVIVAETGLPRSGINDASEFHARWIYSELWLKELIARLSKQTVSQPLSKLTVSEVYLYELVEKDATLGIECYGLSSTVVYVWLSLLCFVICYAMLEICRQKRKSRRLEALLLWLSDMESQKYQILIQCREHLLEVLPYERGWSAQSTQDLLASIGQMMRDLKNGKPFYPNEDNAYKNIEEIRRLEEEHLERFKDYAKAIKEFRDAAEEYYMDPSRAFDD
ncbi:Glycoside hydrolase family 17 [Arabidopsis suecica]|uniref:glucan endo-1,3-beta-D-glucosidase n=1 Tax=Arabidopsis suecica TaxID=45249 RepID=A0A8T1XNJ6_ARASU|nr:Glycoside hydrolase family 17 [Arabidopsis suecica]